MARDLNLKYMEPLQSTFPTHRLGETGDVAKVYCATCHQGVYKPLNGAKMAQDYPELQTYHSTLPNGANANDTTNNKTTANPSKPVKTGDAKADLKVSLR